MEWIKKNWLTLVCAFGLAALTAFRNYQFKEEVRMMKAIFIVEDTGVPTEWCRTYMFNQMINEAVSITEVMTIEAFKNAGNVALLADALEIESGSIKKVTTLGMKVLNTMDSLGVTMDEFAALFSEKPNSDSYVRGQYMLHKETHKATHFFDIEDGWRELYFSIPDAYKDEYCAPFYWYLKKNGKVMPDRISSRFVKC